MTASVAPHCAHLAANVFHGRFSLAQVEWALWRRAANAFERKPAPAFKLRIKNLLQLDRGEPTRKKRFAFSDDAPLGPGEHNLFSAFDALMLNIALELHDVGAQRKDIVMLLRQLRSALRRDLGEVMNARFKAYASGKGLFEDDYDPAEPENRISLLLARVEEPADYMVEPSFDGALVLHGMSALLEKIEELPPEKLVILPIGASAYLLPSLLMKAPIARRGRRPQKKSRTHKRGEHNG